MEHYKDGTPCNCDRMERTYYKSGELEYETPYINDHIQGKQMLYEYYPTNTKNSTDSLNIEWTHKFETPFEKGKKHGIGHGYFYSGVVSVENNFEHDSWTYQKLFYPSGSIKSEVAYTNDLKNGTERHYHENRVLAEELPFVAGRIHGTRIIHHSTEIYTDGVSIDGYSDYDFPDAPDGNVTRISYENGIRNGMETTHSIDGILLYSVEWKNGKRIGKAITYFPDGTPYKEAVFQYGSDIYGYYVVETYPNGQIDVFDALNLHYLPRRDFGLVKASRIGKNTIKTYEYQYNGVSYSIEVVADSENQIISKSHFQNGKPIQEEGKAHV